ncbi:hypothetical protein [Proteiniphilum propionicum]|jgi:hypothetical protein|uniref:hypothetical protein n=1 Tax=Proteiniphilum propionicum TaxID=2829812 RepID=UPI001EEA5E7D|nr:hypothetical protein [Proteiniphilum propionicum]ULB35647.1 hypothetical protein KDN43_06345 [Proteiniphilum propionicum]
MKTYVLTVSRTFPSTHNRKGEQTYFIEKIGRALGKGKVEVYEEFGQDISPKLHTIRANYPLWKKRFKEIEKGKACLSLRYWSGKPYKSKQIEFARLTKEDGIGLQIVDLRDDAGVEHLASIRDCFKADDRIAKNDGLIFDDFKEWFKGYDLNKPMAIIHFTKFRY